MALAEDEAVAVRPLRVRRVHVQDVVVEHAANLHDRERRADVPAPAAHQHLQDEPAVVFAARVNECALFHQAKAIGPG